MVVKVCKARLRGAGYRLGVPEGYVQAETCDPAGCPGVAQTQSSPGCVGQEKADFLLAVACSLVTRLLALAVVSCLFLAQSKVHNSAWRSTRHWLLPWEASSLSWAGRHAE